MDIKVYKTSREDPTGTNRSWICRWKSPKTQNTFYWFYHTKEDAEKVMEYLKKRWEG